MVGTEKKPAQLGAPKTPGNSLQPFNIGINHYVTIDYTSFNEISVKYSGLENL